MGVIDWLKVLFGTEQFNAHLNALKAINEEYRHKLEQQEKIIKELEALKNKPADDDSNDVRYEREQDAHMQLIECNREKRDLQEKIIFLEYEIKKLRKI